MNPLTLLMALLSAGALSRLAGSSGSGSSATSYLEKEEPEDTGSKEEPEDTGSKEEPKDTGSTGTPAPPENNDFTVDDPDPTPPEQTGGSIGGDSTGPIAHGDLLDVYSGRVTTISAEGDDIASVRIVSGVEHGNVTVNPDNSMALVMTLSDYTGTESFTYEITHSDGSTSTHEVALNVVEGLQQNGWATGEHHYMLATDENDNVIIEHGENHVKVFISGSDSALTLADIARLEGLDVSEVTGRWLAAHGGYGQSEGMALAEDAGMALWGEVTPRHSETSNWLLFERGHEYDFTEEGRVVPRYVNGEDPNHPVYLGAWGEGDKPVLASNLSIATESGNVVVQGLALQGGASILEAHNVIFDDVTITLDQISFSSSSGVTIRNSDVYNSYHDTADETGHAQGIFGNNNTGVLLEGLFLDQNGWHPDYMTETGFNHNIYLGHANLDVTVRDTISMRGSNVGIMVRSGGFLEDNVAIDNNSAIVVLGGDYRDFGTVGQYSLLSDNLVTSAGNKEAVGYKSLGIFDKGEMTSLYGNIVTHLADPDNYDEFLEKYWSQEAVNDVKGNYYDDTIVWNWVGSRSLQYDKYHYDKNFEGLDQSVLDQTTIQRFTAALLGKETATIEDLAMYLRAQAEGDLPELVDSQTILDYFQAGFGFANVARTEAETLRFVPNDIGEGVRWDNRLNWTTEDLPGEVVGDSADLAGNHVIFGGNATIENLETGAEGRLMVHNGKLTVEGEVITSGPGGDAEVHGSGQLWIDGHTGSDLDLLIDGGRLANTGHMRDADLDVHGGQTILGSDGDQWEVGDGHSLSIFDAAAKVGFDGDSGGIAILDFDTGSTLHLSAENGDLGEIGEFRSGAMGDAPDVLSGIDLEGAVLEIDLAGLSTEAGNAFTLMSADEIAGVLAEANIAGLGSRDATIVVDYKADTVRLELTNGSGQTNVRTIGGDGDVEADHDALWAALTADHGVADESVEVFHEDGELAIAV